MDLKKAETLAKSLMKEHGIDNEWEFAWSRSVMTFGMCKRGWKNGVFRQQILLSKRLTEVRSEIPVKMTILHEIAHAIVGPEQGHNEIWRNKCIEIGGNGNSRETTFEDIAKVVKYTYHCGIDDEIIRVSERRLSTVGLTCRFHYGADVHRKHLVRGVRVLDTDIINEVG